MLVALSERGAGARPVLASFILIVGAAAGLAPLRVGLPIAIVLACFQGTIEDFAGSPGRYWKEAFVLALVLRSLARRRPTRAETAVLLAVAVLGALYLLTGSPARDVGWAFKILLEPIAAGWAVMSFQGNSHVWTRVYTALAGSMGANLVLAAWQRIRGPTHLLNLGLSYGDRIRIAPAGTLRVFGGFTSPAAFSYIVALTILAWIAMLFTGGEARQRALKTTWVPAACAVGIALSLDRIALVALTVAALAMAVRDRSSRALLPLGAAGALIAALLVVGPSSGFLAQGFTLGSESADARRALWPQYWTHLSVLGTGPAAAGAAYQKAHRLPSPLPVEYVQGWQPIEGGLGGAGFRWMGTAAALRIGGSGARPGSMMSMTATSLAVPRRLTIRVGREPPFRVKIPATGSRTVSVRLPSGPRSLVVSLEAEPPAQSASTVSPGDLRILAIQISTLRVSPLAKPSLAETILSRAKADKRGAALASTEPGVVDNQYLTWLFQYGILLGSIVCLLWLSGLLWPFFVSGRSPLLYVARGWGAFIVVAGLGVDVWEEFPVGLLAALIISLGISAWRQDATGRRSRQLHRPPEPLADGGCDVPTRPRAER